MGAEVTSLLVRKTQVRCQELDEWPFGECVASFSKPTVVPVSYSPDRVLDSLQQTDCSLQGDAAAQLTWEARSLACAVPLDFGY